MHLFLKKEKEKGVELIFQSENHVSIIIQRNLCNQFFFILSNVLISIIQEGNELDNF